MKQSTHVKPRRMETGYTAGVVLIPPPLAKLVLGGGGGVNAPPADQRSLREARVNVCLKLRRNADRSGDV